MSAPGYRRDIGLFSATMLVAGSMIGSGIFLVSAEILRTGRTPGFLMLSWALAGLLSVSGALSFAELGSVHAKAGGYYVYLREAFGPLAGFLCGWTSFLVIECGSIAAVAVGFGRYLGSFVPAVNDTTWWIGPARVAEWHPFPQWAPQFALGPYELGLTPARAAGIALILLFMGIHAHGVKLGAWVQNVFSLGKIAALGALILLGLALKPAVAPSMAPLAAEAGSLPFLVALLVAQVGCLFSGDGWQYLAMVGGEIREPRRTLPRAMLLGTLLVFGLYLLANLGYLRVLGPAGIAHAPGDRVASTALGALLGGRAERLMAGAILMSMVGWMNGGTLTSARVYQAMAEDGLFFQGARKLNDHGVPMASMRIMAAWACVLTLTGAYSQLLEYVIFSALLFYAATAAGSLVLRRKAAGGEGYRAPTLLTLFYVGGSGAILCSLLIHRPSFSLPGLVLVLLGIPAYRLLRRGSAVVA
ncbi:MAG TPA: amino acid permease [Holophagaceae bacterium]|nr:amino acid permease [Holophagaceae bacterium]